jgi:hypothetical protein
MPPARRLAATDARRRCSSASSSSSNCSSDGGYRGDDSADEPDFAAACGGSVGAAIVGRLVRLVPPLATRPTRRPRGETALGLPAAAEEEPFAFPGPSALPPGVGGGGDGVPVAPATRASLWSQHARARPCGRAAPASPWGRRDRRTGVSLSGAQGHALLKQLAVQRAAWRRRGSLFHGGAEEAADRQAQVRQRRARGDGELARQRAAQHCQVPKPLPPRWARPPPPERWRELQFCRGRLGKQLALAAGAILARHMATGAVPSGGGAAAVVEQQSQAAAAAKRQQEEAANACAELGAECAGLSARIAAEAAAALQRLEGAEGGGAAETTRAAPRAEVARLRADLKRGGYELRVLVEMAKVFVAKLEMVLAHLSTAASLSLRRAVQGALAGLLDAWAAAHGALSQLGDVQDGLQRLYGGQ